eukprot:scaffold31492_cov25-Tisochrysis_lutea.AAC.2
MGKLRCCFVRKRQDLGMRYAGLASQTSPRSTVLSKQLPSLAAFVRLGRCCRMSVLFFHRWRWPSEANICTGTPEREIKVSKKHCRACNTSIRVLPYALAMCARLGRCCHKCAMLAH